MLILGATGKVGRNIVHACARIRFAGAKSWYLARNACSRKAGALVYSSWMQGEMDGRQRRRRLEGLVGPSWEYECGVNGPPTVHHPG